VGEQAIFEVNASMEPISKTVGDSSK